MKNKTIIIYALIVLFILVMWWIFVTYASNRQEPIQKILNQIEANESELEQLEIKQAELNQANEQAKEELLNKYGLQLSEEKEEKKTDLSSMLYDDNWNCIWWIGCWPNDRTPWKLSEDWTHQEMPEIKATDEHERFKELATAYWLDASTIWSVENHYWIKEWVILCITVAETSGWNRGYAHSGKPDQWPVRHERPPYLGKAPERHLYMAGKENVRKVMQNHSSIYF